MNDAYKNLVFLDTETTGLGPDDRLCQCAYIYQDQEYNELFKPPLDISVEASSISHVTNRHVADKPAFDGSAMQNHLTEIFSNPDSIIIAHNAPFDIGMLNREGIEVAQYIDTKKVAQAMDPNGTIPRYNMQYLRYHLDLQVEGAQAHDALGDVLVLKALFDRQYNRLIEGPNPADGRGGKTPDEILDWMKKVSQEPNFVHTIMFGKYKGQKTKDIAARDPGYLKWLLGQKQEQVVKGEIGEDDDWIYTINQLLNS